MWRSLRISRTKPLSKQIQAMYEIELKFEFEFDFDFGFELVLDFEFGLYWNWTWIWILPELNWIEIKCGIWLWMRRFNWIELEIGIGTSIGKFETLTAFDNIDKSGIIYHIPFSFGLELGKNNNVDLGFAYYFQPSVEQYVGAFAVGITFQVNNK